MNRPLTLGEKMRIFDTLHIASWRDGKTPLCMKDAKALRDYRRELARYGRGEPIEIPPPMKWPDSGPRRWSKAEIAAVRQDPKRTGEYLAILNRARSQLAKEAIAAKGDG